MDAKLLSMIKKEPESRTTCTLTNEGSAALQCLTEDFGLSQKMVFNLFVAGNGIDEDILKAASAINAGSFNRDIRKCLVISKKTLRVLNYASETTGIPRDIIVDLGVRHLSSLLNTLRETSLNKHKKARVILNELWCKLELVEKDLKGLLDSEDPILTRFSTVIVVLMNLVNAIDDEIDNNVPIDPDGM